MNLKALDTFVLVGGTALALQLGHRLSDDLDMFSEKPFNEDSLLNLIQQNFENTNIIGRDVQTLNMAINNIKVDLIQYNYPLLEDIVVESGVRMMSTKDIAAMKLSSVSSRGVKKDFYDIYFLLQQYSLQQMLAFYQAKFKVNNVFHVLKSLDYFDDAEKSADVALLTDVSWEMVKKYIGARVKEFAA
jgi:predicted nucleotidyltransferase component of viral defense system